MDIEVVLFVPPTNNQTGERTFKFTGVEAPSIENGVLEVFAEETDEEESYSIADFRDWSYWRQVATRKPRLYNLYSTKEKNRAD